VRAVGVRSVALSDDVFTDHFPGNPVLPGVYLVEGLAQTAGLLLWESSHHAKIAVMVSIDRARFTSFARPGDSVRLEVDIDSYDEKIARIRGVAAVDERQVAAVALTFSLQEPETVIAPIFLPYFAQAADFWLGRYPVGNDKTAKHD